VASFEQRSPNGEDEAVENLLRRVASALDPQDATALFQYVEERFGRFEASQRRQEIELRCLDRAYRNAESRLWRLENSAMFRLLRAVGGFAGRRKRALGEALLHSAFHPLYLKLSGKSQHLRAYAQWTAWTTAELPSREWHVEAARKWRYQPCISVVMAVHDPHPDWLRGAIQSVRDQTYSNWELCLCDDSSRQAWVRPFLDKCAASDPRIRCAFGASPLGISGALNRACELAGGEYATFLDHDDFLSPLALHYVVDALQENRADLLYSDEDHVDKCGQPVRPNFKPDWSPTLLTTCMYMGHPLVVSRARLLEIGGFRSEMDGAQDYDLALRLTDATARVAHVRRVLYHWREHDGSTAANPAAKPYTHKAGARALEDTVRRRNWDAAVLDGPSPNTYTVRHRLHEHGRVSIIICTRSSRLLHACLEGIRRRTDYPSLEIVVVHHESAGTSAENEKVRRVLKESGMVAVAYSGSFNFSAMNNRGADAASGEYLVFLNDDVIPLVPDWLSCLVAQLQRDGAGVAGGKLLYPDGSIQHAGIALSIMDGTGHPGRHVYQSDYWKWLNFTRNVTAVTGACMAVRKTTFRELGGFDPCFPVNYNDVDFCLRARKAGYEVVLESGAALRHMECQTRRPGTCYDERRLFYQRWTHLVEIDDPYYTPHLDRTREDPSLAGL
jgi:O-antigen biosynthesis protein